MELMRFTGLERFILLDIDDDAYIFGLDSSVGQQLDFRDPLGDLLGFMAVSEIESIECKEPFIDSDELQDTIEALAENGGNAEDLQNLKNLLLNGNAVIR